MKTLFVQSLAVLMEPTRRRFHHAQDLLDVASTAVERACAAAGAGASLEGASGVTAGLHWRRGAGSPYVRFGGQFTQQHPFRETFDVTVTTSRHRVLCQAQPRSRPGDPRACRAAAALASSVEAALAPEGWRLLRQAAAAAMGVADGFTAALAYQHPADGTRVVPWRLAGRVTGSGLQIRAETHVDSEDLTGGFVRDMALDRRGRLVVTCRHAVVQPGGSGLGVAYQRHLFDRLSGFGADRVELTAARMGSYAWARAGFAFSNPAAVAAHLEARVAGTTTHLPARVAPGVDARLQDPQGVLHLAELLRSDRPPGAAEVAGFGADQRDDAGVHDGMRLLLGFSWRGERQLQPTAGPLVVDQPGGVAA